MKQAIRLGFASIAIIGMVSCDGAQEKAGEMQRDEMAMHDSMPAASQEKVIIKDENLNAVYQHYVHLTTALTNSDAAEAKIASNAIEAGSRNVTGGENLASSAAKVTSAKTIDEQRNEYAKLSNELIALVKKSGVSFGQLYVDFCPMAMNDKGAYWLSSQKDIKNPFFGEKMLNCGEVKETISE